MPEAYILSLLAFGAAATVLTLTPGVDTAMVLRSSTSAGPAAGAAAGLGVCFGLMVWGGAAALGLTALLAASPVAFLAVQWAGAAYLLALGVKLIARPGAPPPVVRQAATGPQDRADVFGALRRGFLTNILNPKVGVFYASFLPQFLPREVEAAGFAFLLAFVHVLITALWFAALIALTVPLARLLRRPPVARFLDRLTGCVFVGFGLKLAIAQRP